MFFLFRLLGSRLTQGILLGLLLVIAATYFIEPLKLEYRTASPTPVPQATPAPSGAPPTPETQNPPGPAPGTEFETLQEVYNILRDNSYLKGDLDPVQLQEQTIHSFLESLDDPYLRYSPPHTNVSQSEQLAGEYQGIGAEVSLRDGPATIIAPFAGSPAQKAGILPGDVILEVDGESTEGWSLAELVSHVKGEAGTDVRLLILHRNEETPVLITVTRGVIPIESVFSAMLEDGIAYFRISSFSDATSAQLEAALQRSLDEGARAAVLDVRFNPGGFLQATLDSTSKFLSGGVILTEVSGDGEERSWDAAEGSLGADLPLAVLVNSFSASGAEVFAGALADHGLARTFGATTYGKGSVTSTSVLSNGYGLSYSLARWLTPNGDLIEGAGLTPDVPIEQPLEIPIGSAGDLQLIAAVDYLREILG